MVPIETATPEQVEHCVEGLLTRIRQLEAVNQALEKDGERLSGGWRNARAEIERLRGALGWYVGRSAESLMFNGSRRAIEALSEATE